MKKETTLPRGIVPGRKERKIADKGDNPFNFLGLGFPLRGGLVRWMERNRGPSGYYIKVRKRPIFFCLPDSIA